MIGKEPDLVRARILDRWAVAVTIVVYVLVGMMRQVKIETAVDFSFLPAVYSSLNVVVAISLVVALIRIRRKNVDGHRRAIYLALSLSAVFLMLYVVYHFTTPATEYCGQDMMRNVYYFLLGTHIVLAGIMLPFILFTFIRAYTGQYERHRRLARWVWPFWFYVAITGPIVYVMLLPCYA